MQHTWYFVEAKAVAFVFVDYLRNINLTNLTRPALPNIPIDHVVIWSSILSQPHCRYSKPNAQKLEIL